MSSCRRCCQHLPCTYASSGVRTAGSRVNCASKLYVKWSSSALTAGTNGGGTPFCASFTRNTHTHTLEDYNSVLMHPKFPVKLATHRRVLSDTTFCSLKTRTWVVVVCTHQIPVDGLEERMAGDVGERGVWLAAEPIGRVLVEEVAQHLAGLHAERPRYANGALEDHLEQIVLGILSQRER